MKHLLVSALWVLGLAATSSAQDQPPPALPPAPTQPAQTAATAPAAKPDYSKEPFIFQQYTTEIRFENDGTGEREYIARILVQSDAGVQALGELVFGFSSANEQMNINYVRVRKPDGSVVTAGADAAKEMTAAVERDAPVYTDYKEKHITVPSLKAGDTLEYDIDVHITDPFASGEFWYAQNFLTGSIVLDETLQVDLPKGRAVKVSSPGNDASITNTGGRTLYSWKHSEITRPTDEELKKQAENASDKSPDVQFSTFKSWADVAAWYARIAQGRDDPSPEIRAKVADLTAGKTTNLEKIQPLYNYVAENIRYVSLSFGVGRYQPHTAAEVFANQYGDCKDKATLLSSMLRAAGISSDLVLIPATATLDESMPSPAQFDHVITAVPASNDLLWIDSTTEVAPFRLLASTLRDKSALLVPPLGAGAGRIVKTPADPPFLSTQTVEIAGDVSDLGKLTGTIHYALRGDQELLLRIVFRHTPQTQWKSVGNTILHLDGLDADATSVDASDPADTQKPFELTIHFEKDNFLVWSSKQTRLELPLLAISLPEAAQDNTEPIKLGSPLEVVTRLKLTLPETFQARTPIAVSVSRDYAAFTSTYSFSGHTLSAERSLDFKAHELPADRTSDYLAFTHAVQADENQPLLVENASAGPPQIPATAKASELLDAGRAALQEDNPQAAIPLFQRVVELNPQDKQAWNDLGLAFMRVGKNEDAASSFRKQLEVNPYDEYANNYLAYALNLEQKYDDAAAAFRKQIEINPLDTTAHTGLGEILSQQHRYNEALPELEKAAALNPDNPMIEVELGNAYLNTAEKDKALAAFDKAATTSQTPPLWNNIAYDLAQQKIELDKAQRYAESAVASTDADLRNVDLAHLTLDQLGQMTSIGVYWDTLGWVHFQQGDFATAGRYIRAAWLLTQHGEVSDHLAQVLEKQGQKDQAADAFAEALAARHSVPETRSRLILLLGGNQKIDGMVTQAGPELAKERTFSLGKLAAEKADADFEILLSPSGAGGSSAKVDDVKFVSGSNSLRSLADKLRSIDFGPIFPDASPLKIVRRGTLSCSSSGDCSFVLALPEDVHSLN